jgi:hypothetical protein
MQAQRLAQFGSEIRAILHAFAMRQDTIEMWMKSQRTFHLVIVQCRRKCR